MLETGPTQLLQAWNPLTEPLTVKAHVDGLLKSGRDRYVWFGRIYAGRQPEATTEEGARARWPAVAAVADELERGARELLLLVTNFRSLHAFRVDKILFGTAATAKDLAHVPAYYRGNTVTIWFRVRDIRPVSHDQMASLEWLRERTLVEPEAQPGKSAFSFGFDPYRSFHFRYPVALRSVSAGDLFDYSQLRHCPPDRQFFAAQAGTVFPPDVESCWEALRRDLDPPWSLLEEASRVFLASAMLVEGLGMVGPGGRFALEPSAALVLLSKAVETECRTLLEYARRVTASAPVWRESPPTTALTLGEIGNTIRGLAEPTRALHLSVTSNLARNDEWLAWLEEFARSRNRAAHAEPLPRSEYERHRDAIYAKNTSRLALIAHAKKELLAVD
jgi:hypothetical protein